MLKANTATSQSGILGSSLRWSRVPKALSTALGSTYSASSALLAFFSMKMAKEATTPAGQGCLSQVRTQAASFPETCLLPLSASEAWSAQTTAADPQDTGSAGLRLGTAHHRRRDLPASQ